MSACTGLLAEPDAEDGGREVLVDDGRVEPGRRSSSPAPRPAPSAGRTPVPPSCPLKCEAKTSRRARFTLGSSSRKSCWTSLARHVPHEPHEDLLLEVAPDEVAVELGRAELALVDGQGAGQRAVGHVQADGVHLDPEDRLGAHAHAEEREVRLARGEADAGARLDDLLVDGRRLLKGQERDQPGGDHPHLGLPGHGVT